MLEIERHKMLLKITAIIVIFSVIVFFCFLPVAMFGGLIENTANSTVDTVDTWDGRDSFTPETGTQDTMLQKLQKTF